MLSGKESKFIGKNEQVELKHEEERLTIFPSRQNTTIVSQSVSIPEASKHLESVEMSWPISGGYLMLSQAFACLRPDYYNT